MMTKFEVYTAVKASLDNLTARIEAAELAHDGWASTEASIANMRLRQWRMTQVVKRMQREIALARRKAAMEAAQKVAANFNGMSLDI